MTEAELAKEKERKKRKCANSRRFYLKTKGPNKRLIEKSQMLEKISSGFLECKECGQVKKLSEYRKTSCSYLGVLRRCLECERADHKKIHKRAYERDIDKLKLKRKYDSENLTDFYVRSVIADGKLSINAIPDALVVLKRASLKLMRASKLQIPDGSRFCPHCGMIKLESEFPGKYGWCRDCSRIYASLRNAKLSVEEKKERNERNKAGRIAKYGAEGVRALDRARYERKIAKQKGNQ
jgi:hypothetical protein